MKFALLFVLAAVVAVSTSEVADPSSTNRATALSIGVISSNDRLLRSFVVSRVASSVARFINVRFTAPTGTRVRAVRVRGSTQFATVRRTGGGVDFTFINLQFVQAANRAFSFNVQIWGR